MSGPRVFKANDPALAKAVGWQSGAAPEAADADASAHRPASDAYERRGQCPRRWSTANTDSAVTAGGTPPPGGPHLLPSGGAQGKSDSASLNIEIRIARFTSDR